MLNTPETTPAPGGNDTRHWATTHIHTRVTEQRLLKVQVWPLGSTACAQFHRPATIARGSGFRVPSPQRTIAMHASLGNRAGSAELGLRQGNIRELSRREITRRRSLTLTTDVVDYSDAVRVTNVCRASRPGRLRQRVDALFTGDDGSHRSARRVR